MLDEERDLDEELENKEIDLNTDLIVDDGVNLGGEDLELDEEGYGMSYSMPRGLDE